MSVRPPPRSAILAGTAAVLLLGGAVLTLWPKLERRWHVWRLERDPSLFESLLLSERSPCAEAAVEFLRQDRGRQALCELFVKELDACDPRLGIAERLADRSRDVSEGGRLALVLDGIQQQTWKIRQGWSSFSMALQPADAKRRQRVLDLLGACAGRSFRLESLPGIELHFTGVTDGRAERPPWLGDTPDAEVPSEVLAVSNGARHVCFYRSLPKVTGRSAQPPSAPQSP